MTPGQFRSLLFVPASRPDMAERAHERGADAIILDMEDGVADKDKPAARSTLNALLEALQAKSVQTLVRINSLDTSGELDIRAIADAHFPPLLIPKVTAPEQIKIVEECWQASSKSRSGAALSRLQLLPMIECPGGLFQAEQIAKTTPRVRALVFGSEDFAAEAGLNTTIDALAVPAQWVALAAAAAGIPAYGLPGSLANYQDMALFGDTLQRARTIGFTGSVCVHPKQVLLANKIFMPTDDEIKWARAVVAQAGAGGATGGEVGMVDAPVLARASAILKRAPSE